MRGSAVTKVTGKLGRASASIKGDLRHSHSEWEFN